MKFELLGGKPFVRDRAGNFIPFAEFMQGNWSPRLVERMLIEYRNVYGLDFEWYPDDFDAPV